MKDLLIHSISFLFFSVAALHGLLGSLKGEFRYPSGGKLFKGTMSPKNYFGKSARVWGVIFFIGFALLPALLFATDIETSNNVVATSVYYLFLTIVAFLVARNITKHGLHSYKKHL